MNVIDAAILRRVGGVTIMRIALLGLWFIGLILAYRTLGAQPNGIEQAGVLALALAGIKMITSAFGDALDMEVVRRVPPILNKDPQKAARIWRTAQQMRLGLGLLALALGVLFANAIASLMMHDTRWSGVVMLMGAAALTEFLYRGHLADFQSQERFGRFLLCEAALQVLRVGGLIVLVLTESLHVESFLAIYAAAPLAVTLSALAVVDVDRRKLLRLAPTEALAAWRYVRWIIPAMMVSAVVERLDLLMLTGLRGPEESGPYGALAPLLLAPEAAAGFAIATLQPRVADLIARGEAGAFWLAISAITLPLALFSWIVVALIPETLILLTIGPSYVEAAPVLVILLGAVLLWLGIAPVPMSIVVMTSPRATLMLCLGQGAAMIGLTSVLIPTYGMVGAATALLVMRALTAVVISIAAWLVLRHRRGATVAE